MMLQYDSGMINEIGKSAQYASEPERLQNNSNGWQLKGNHREHHIVDENGSLKCDCSFYNRRGICAHLMALERLGLIPLLKPATNAFL